MRRPMLASLAAFATTTFVGAQTPVLSDEFPVNIATVGYQRQPSVATIGPTGNFVVTWMGSLYSEPVGERGRMFDVTGTPLGGEFAVSASGEGTFQSVPDVGSNTNGDFVVTWMDTGTSRDIFARRFNSSGVPQGGNIAVNTYTTGSQDTASVALDSSGKFVVVWESQDGSGGGVFGQRFDETGVKLGNEFQINQYTTDNQIFPRVTMSATGEFLVVWQNSSLGEDVMARRYDNGGAPLGDEFQVNTRSGLQTRPRPAYLADGSAIVVWSGPEEGSGASNGIYGQRLDDAGGLLGPEFNVNTYTTGPQVIPAVAASSQGGFVVLWDSTDQAFSIRAQHYDAAGRRIGPEQTVNAFTSGGQGYPRVAAQPNGQFVAVWESEDGSFDGIASRIFGFPATGVIAVDAPHAAAAQGGSNLNGVLEPGESVSVEPSFVNGSDTPLTLTGTASFLGGLPGPTYTLQDASAHYGTIAAGATNNCFSLTGDCYRVAISGSPRPAQHWEARFVETLSYNDFERRVLLHIGGSFPDVPQDAYYPFIENVFHNGITAGCQGGGYCPESNVTRAQMAVFLLKSRWGAGFLPRPATGTVFNDVQDVTFAAPWIEELVRQGVTAGCGGGNYCPASPVTRQQMAVFLLKTKYGAAYVPPDGVGLFGDVAPCPGTLCNFIEDLYNQQVTGGCQAVPLLYCPGSSVLRQQMAVFLVKMFGLQLYEN